jgi:hypothetical protein
LKGEEAIFIYRLDIEHEKKRGVKNNLYAYSLNYEKNGSSCFEM